MTETRKTAGETNEQTRMDVGVWVPLKIYLDAKIHQTTTINNGPNLSLAILPPPPPVRTPQVNGIRQRFLTKFLQVRLVEVRKSVEAKLEDLEAEAVILEVRIGIGSSYRGIGRWYIVRYDGDYHLSQTLGDEV